MTIHSQFFPHFQSSPIVAPGPLEQWPQKSQPTIELALLAGKPAVKEMPLGDKAYQWVSETPKASIVAGVGALGSTLWYGLSYSGSYSAPWQSVVGSLGAVCIAAPFEVYENYTLFQNGKRSLSHSILDGVSDTLSAGVATYIGSSVGSLIISTAATGLAAGAAVPLGVVLGAAVVATGITIGAGYILSELKNGIFEDIGIS
jgi:hypothetical protein